MGNFPIYRTGATPSGRGPSVMGDVDFRTGAAEYAEALGGLGGAMAGVGMDIHRLDAQSQLADAIMEDQRAIQELAVKFENNTDPTTYTEQLKETLSVIQTREIKNGLARREHDLWVKRMIPHWEKATTAAQKARVKSNWYSSLFNAQVRAEQTGLVSSFDTFVKKGIESGMIEEHEATEILFKTKHNAERRMAVSWAMNNPEQLLQFVKGDKIEGFELLTPGDVIDIRAIAVGQQRYNGQKVDTAKENAKLKIWKKALNRDLENMPQFVNSFSGVLTVDEMQEELRKAYSIADLISQGKGNPYIVRQDEKAFAEMVYRLDTNPQSVRIQDLWSGVGKRWTVNDYLFMRKMLPSSEHFEFRISDPVTKTYLDDLRALYPEEMSDEERIDYSDKYFEVVNMLMSNWGDGAKIEKNFQRITQNVKKERSKGLLDYINYMGKQAWLEPGSLFYHPFRWQMKKTRAYIIGEEKTKEEYLATAVDPKTGKRIGWNGKEWIPIE